MFVLPTTIAPARAQAGDVQAVARRRRGVGEHERALRGRQALDVVDLLGEQRQAGERAEALAAGGGGVDGVRLGERLVGAQARRRRSSVAS